MIWWKWMLIAAAVPIGIGVLVYAVGMALPERHVATASAVIASPADRIAGLIREVEAQPRWRSGVTAIEILERNGDQLLYVERKGGDAITFALREERPGALFRSTIADPDLPFGGYWTIALRPVAEGTAVDIEEHGTVSNPIFRFVSRFIFGHEATMKAYLGDLKRAVGERS